MVLIVCLDDNNGMMFNNRRQSRDKKVIEDIVQNHDTIHISEYSKPLFENEKIQVKIIEEEAEPENNEVYFIENEKAFDYAKIADTLIIYKWNRKYPGDLFFYNWEKDWEKESSFEFEGNSHEKITKETYKRRDANA